MSEVWRVPLPSDARPPLRVFVNAVEQVEGRDFVFADGELRFDRPLMKEQVGFWRWTAMFLALFGTYGRNDSVDVEYTADGVKRVASGLEIVAPDGSRSVVRR